MTAAINHASSGGFEKYPKARSRDHDQYCNSIKKQVDLRKMQSDEAHDRQRADDRHDAPKRYRVPDQYNGGGPRTHCSPLRRGSMAQKPVPK